MSCPALRVGVVYDFRNPRAHRAGVGMGYAPHEFHGFGIPLPQRPSRTEEGLEVLRRCSARVVTPRLRASAAS